MNQASNGGNTISKILDHLRAIAFKKGGAGSGSWNAPGDPRFAHAGGKKESVHEQNYKKDLQSLVENFDYLSNDELSDAINRMANGYGKPLSDIREELQELQEKGGRYAESVKPGASAAPEWIADTHTVELNREIARYGQELKGSMPPKDREELTAILGHMRAELKSRTDQSREEIRSEMEDERLGDASRLAEEGRFNDPNYVPDEDLRDRLSDPSYGAKGTDSGDLNKFIRHENGKYTVYSEAGKPMGSYATEAEAKKRLQAIEYFKHLKKSTDEARDLIGRNDGKLPNVMNTKPGTVVPTPAIHGRMVDNQTRFPGNGNGQGPNGTASGIGPDVGAHNTHS